MDENKAQVIQQRTSHLFKKLDEMNRRRDEALDSLYRKKFELEVRNNEINTLRSDINKIKDDLEEKEVRAKQLESVLKTAADQFELITSTVKTVTKSAVLQDKRSTGKLNSAELASSRGYRCSNI